MCFWHREESSSDTRGPTPPPLRERFFPFCQGPLQNIRQAVPAQVPHCTVSDSVLLGLSSAWCPSEDSQTDNEVYKSSLPNSHHGKMSLNSGAQGFYFLKAIGRLIVLLRSFPIPLWVLGSQLTLMAMSPETWVTINSFCHVRISCTPGKRYSVIIKGKKEEQFSKNWNNYQLPLQLP